MSFRTRFGKWVVVACMGAVAACTGQDDGGTVAGDELNIIFPNGTMGPFEAARVTVLASCDGSTVDPYFGETPSAQTIFETDLELVNDSPTTGMVWHTFFDLLGNCQFDVSVFEPDGELFCAATAFAFGLAPGDTEALNMMVNCDISQNIETATLDFHIDEFIIAVGNFCPFAHSLETIPDEIPLTPSPIQIPNPALDGSWPCMSDANCVGSGPGKGCDNDTTSPTYLTCFPSPNTTEFQLCALDAADVDIATATISSCGNRCDTADGSDPGNLSFTCTATLADGSPSQGTFSDPANGGVGQDLDLDPTTYNGWCSNAAIPPELMLQLPVSVGYFICSDAEPGLTVTISCTGGDGDVDCNKTRTAEVTCAGIDECIAQGEDCDDGDPCTADICNPLDASCTNPADPGANGDSCSTNPGSPEPGICENGGCVDAGLCDGVDCGSPTDCFDGGTCNPNTGDCEGGSGELPDDTECDTAGSGPGACTGGVCIGNCTGVVCDADPNDCIDGGSCDATDGSCPTPQNQPQGTPCDFAGTLDGACGDNNGLCEEVVPAMCVIDPDLGAGAPDEDCNNPNLTAAPNSNLTGINTKCLILGDPDISGSMTFADAGGGNFNVSGVQDLLFTIDVTIPAVSARVIIDTDSSTVFTGTATGAVPGTLTMDPLTPPFNVNAAATGISTCTALNQLFIGFTCTEDIDCPFGAACPDPILPDTPPCGQICGSAGCLPTDVSTQVCPLANLGPGDNDVPLPGDPGTRSFPPITVGAATFELGAGPADPTGWYLSNPAPMAGNGTQWVALAGDVTTGATYDLSQSLFKPYNSLLPILTFGTCDSGPNVDQLCQVNAECN